MCDEERGPSISFEVTWRRDDGEHESSRTVGLSFQGACKMGLEHSHPGKHLVSVVPTYGLVKAGTRVRVKETIAVYPEGAVPARALGVVTEMLIDPDGAEYLGLIQLDVRLPWLDEWHNCLQVSSGETYFCRWDQFEVLI